MGRLLEFVINYDSPRQVYYPGEQLHGYVVLNLSAPKKIKLKVEIEGNGFCHWTETSSAGDNKETEHYTGHEKLLEQAVMLFGSRQHPAGRQTYRFTFQLPHALPSSFESETGHIRYHITAHVDGAWSFDHKTKRPLIINEIIDINQRQFLNGPGGDKTKEVGCLCCAAGPIALHGHLDRAGYCPGETMMITSQLENTSSRDMDGMTAKLIQYVEYHASRKTKRVSKTIARIDGSTVPGGEVANWINEPFGIPAIPPSIMTSRVVNVRYELRIDVKVPMGVDLKLPLPITVGTVPFCGTYGMSNNRSLPPNQVLMPDAVSFTQPSAPMMPPPPTQLFGYPEMPPPSLAAAIGDVEVNIADGDEKELFGQHRYIPVYTFAQPHSSMQWNR